MRDQGNREGTGGGDRDVRGEFLAVADFGASGFVGFGAGEVELPIDGLKAGFVGFGRVA